MESKLSDELYLKKILPCDEKLCPPADWVFHGQVGSWPPVHERGHGRRCMSGVITDAANYIISVKLPQQHLTAVHVPETYKFLFYEICS